MSKQEYSSKIFVIGIDKTGTTCVEEALEILFQKPCLHLKNLSEKDGKRWLQLQECRMDAKARQEQLNILLRDHTMASGFPVSAFLPDLLQLYPDSKFILTTRDAETWLATVRSTTLPKRQERLDNQICNKIRQLFGLQVFEQLYLNAMRACLGKEVKLDDDNQLMKCYVRWNEHVKDTVAADRLLIFNVKDGWDPLCTYLGVPKPKNVFPRYPRRRSSITVWKKSTLNIWAHWIVSCSVYAIVGFCIYNHFC